MELAFSLVEWPNWKQAVGRFYFYFLCMFVYTKSYLLTPVWKPGFLVTKVPRSRLAGLRSTKSTRADTVKVEETLQVGTRTEYKRDPTGEQRIKAFIECS